MRTIREFEAATRSVPITRGSGLRVCDLGAVQVVDSTTLVVVPYADRDADVLAAAISRVDSDARVARVGGALVVSWMPHADAGVAAVPRTAS